MVENAVPLDWTNSIIDAGEQGTDAFRSDENAPLLDRAPQDSACHVCPSEEGGAGTDADAFPQPNGCRPKLGLGPHEAWARLPAFRNTGLRNALASAAAAAKPESSLVHAATSLPTLARCRKAAKIIRSGIPPGTTNQWPSRMWHWRHPPKATELLQPVHPRKRPWIADDSGSTNLDGIRIVASAVDAHPHQRLPQTCVGGSVGGATSRVKWPERWGTPPWPSKAHGESVGTASRNPPADDTNHP